LNISVGRESVRANEGNAPRAAFSRPVRANRKERDVTVFVVAHGAWSAGWAWKKMRPLLRAELWTPTYTGLGERAHLANPAIDLDTHIADVIGVLEMEDLRDVVLIAHSYGGMVATGVADRARERIAQLIYLDAFVPHDGQSLFDLQPPDARARMRELARTDGEGWRLPPTQMPADTPDADVAWASGRRRPQPVRTFEQPLRLAGNAAPPPPQLHLLPAMRSSGRIPPVRRARPTRKRLALFRDRRQP
jgi:pimeloyl-ACP methyl ester carboxylesterase